MDVGHCVWGLPPGWRAVAAGRLHIYMFKCIIHLSPGPHDPPGPRRNRTQGANRFLTTETGNVHCQLPKGHLCPGEHNGH